MCTQRTLNSVVIAGLVVFAQSAATADVAMMPNTQASVLLGLDRDAPLRQRLECTQPMPQQIRENLAPSTQGTRAYLESARRDLDWNLPPGELKVPNVLELVRIPLDRTIRHPLTPNLDLPFQNEEGSQFLDLAEVPLHLPLPYPLSNRLC
jgi:hypothetical protein